MEEKDAIQTNLEKSGLQEKASLVNLSVEQNKIENLEEEIKELVVQNNAFTMEIKDLYEKLSDLRISEKSLKHHLKNEQLTLNNTRSKLAECEAKLKMEQEKISEQERAYAEQQEKLKEKISEQEKLNKRINKFEKKIFALNSSYSFRIGQAFVSAVTKPGKNTVMLPFRFISLILESVFARKDK